MAISVSSTDTATHAVYAIARLSTGATLKYAKTKPAGATDANDAAWQTRMTTEVTNALNQTMSGGNSAAYLASLV